MLLYTHFFPKKPFNPALIDLFSCVIVVYELRIDVLNPAQLDTAHPQPVTTFLCRLSVRNFKTNVFPTPIQLFLSPRKISRRAQQVFVTNLLICITNLVTCITNLLIRVTKFVTKNFLCFRKKFHGRKEKLSARTEKFPLRLSRLDVTHQPFRAERFGGQTLQPQEAQKQRVKHETERLKGFSGKKLAYKGHVVGIMDQRLDQAS